MPESRWFEPATLPTEGSIVVRAMNKAQYDLWVREQPKLLPGQRRFVYASGPRVLEGLRTAAIVYLPRWYTHRDSIEISDVLARAYVRAGSEVAQVHVKELF